MQRLTSWKIVNSLTYHTTSVKIQDIETFLEKTVLPQNNIEQGMS